MDTSRAQWASSYWNSVQDELTQCVTELKRIIRYNGYIDQYVKKCPFHLFDTQRGKNVSRAELKEDISTSLRKWIEVPLTCGQVTKIFSDHADLYLPEYKRHYDATEAFHPYVYSAMMNNPPADGEDTFISALHDELHSYNSACPRMYVRLPQVPVGRILQEVRELIGAKHAQMSITADEVQEQIEFLGQYAILSHRWERDDQELTFDDAADLSDPQVQKKKGLEKFNRFSVFVASEYGCRYLWVDSMCIYEPYRNKSIPLMFQWYRSAYICVIHLMTGPTLWKDEWATRGWTLQEYFAARRIKIIFAHKPDHTGFKFDAFRMEYQNLWLRTPPDSFEEWNDYKHDVDQAHSLFVQMSKRKTTKAVDMAYCLFSAVKVDIPVQDGEDFDTAFYRLQVECLVHSKDPHLLVWDGPSSPYNSMLAHDFSGFPDDDRWVGAWGYRRLEVNFASGAMRIRARLIPGVLSPCSPQSHIFMCVITTSNVDIIKVVGVVLERLPGFKSPYPTYRRVRPHSYKWERSCFDEDEKGEWIEIV